MRHEDRLDRHAELLDGAEDAWRLVARIHDQRALCPVAAHHEAVLLHEPDREHAHVHDPMILFGGLPFALALAASHGGFR